MYVKLFSDILFSSIWQEDDKIRIVWITLLVMADEDGMVEATAPGISHAARIDYDSTLQALKRLESPDPDSRTEAHDGRRIERTEGGYIILNYRKYREMHDRQQKREQSKERSRRYRARQKALKEVTNAVTETDVTDVTQASRPVTRRHAKSRYTEAEAEAKPSHNTLVTIVTKWNEMAKKTGLSQARALTKNRTKKLHTRLKCKDWPWEEAIQRIPSCPFLLGRAEGSRGWVADFNWFIENDDNALKVVEGRYDGRTQATGKGRGA